MRNTLMIAAIAGLFSLAGCSSTPTPTETKTATETETKKAPTGPPEPVTAKTAYYAMYTPARQWATDLVGLSLTGGDVAGVKSAGGKFGMWTAVFASPSLRAARTYTYAVAEQLPTIQRGVKAEGTEAWAGPTQKVMPFQNSDFTTDSDAAYMAAAEKASKFLADNPDKKITAFALGAATRFPAPVWYIMWGDSKLGYAAFVNATTGKVMSK